MKQEPKEKTPSHRNPEAAPLAELRDPLLLQYIQSRGHAGFPGDVHSQRLAQAFQQL